jgi:hypothetical protein
MGINIAEECQGVVPTESNNVVDIPLSRLLLVYVCPQYILKPRTNEYVHNSVYKPCYWYLIIVFKPLPLAIKTM